MKDLFQLDETVDEVRITEWQFRDLHDKYGTQGIIELERQILEQGLIMERIDHDNSLRIRRRRMVRPSPNPTTEIN